MAVKTKAQILSEIASLLADNTTGDISANDVTWMMNLITTLKLEGYFYVDYSIASHVQDYFVSVEKGDNKNIG